MLKKSFIPVLLLGVFCSSPAMKVIKPVARILTRTPHASACIASLQAHHYLKALTQMKNILRWAQEHEVTECRNYVVDHVVELLEDPDYTGYEIIHLWLKEDSAFADALHHKAPLHLMQWIPLRYGPYLFLQILDTASTPIQNLIFQQCHYNFLSLITIPNTYAFLNEYVQRNPQESFDLFLAHFQPIMAHAIGRSVIQQALDTVFTQDYLEVFAARIPASIPHMIEQTPMGIKIHLFAPDTHIHDCFEHEIRRGTIFFEKRDYCSDAIFFNTEGKRVGFCSYCLHTAADGIKHADIALLRILAEERKKGYGSLLLRAVQKKLFEAGCTRIQLHPQAHDLKPGEAWDIMQQKLLGFYNRHGGRYITATGTMEFTPATAT